MGSRYSFFPNWQKEKIKKYTGSLEEGKKEISFDRQTYHADRRRLLDQQSVWEEEEGRKGINAQGKESNKENRKQQHRTLEQNSSTESCSEKETRINYFLSHACFRYFLLEEEEEVSIIARERENQGSKSKWKGVQKESHNSVTDNKNSRGRETS